MAPVLEDVSKQIAGQAVVVKLNAEQNQELVRQYSVIGIPTLLFFSHGRLVDRKTGLQSAQAIARRLTPLLHFSADEAAGREITGLFRLPARPHMWLAAALGITAMLGAAWFWLY
jgi:thioredoxin-like negative regulator of GroEL